MRIGFFSQSLLLKLTSKAPDYLGAFFFLGCELDQLGPHAIVPRALFPGFRNFYLSGEFECRNPTRRDKMGRSILLWLLGVPIPIIILLALFWH